MNAKTDTEGNVNSILVTIYDSLEQMYGDLCLDLELHSKSGFLKYKKDKSDVLMNLYEKHLIPTDGLLHQCLPDVDRGCR